MAAAQKRNPCPFCKKVSKMIAPFRRNNDPGISKFQVPCHCGAAGPWKPTWKLALRAWNRTKDRK